MNNFRVGDVCIWNYRDDFGCVGLKKGMEVKIVGVDLDIIHFKYELGGDEIYGCLDDFLTLIEEENE